MFSLLIWSLSRLGERDPSDAGFERSLTVLRLMEQVDGWPEGGGIGWRLSVDVPPWLCMVHLLDGQPAE